MTDSPDIVAVGNALIDKTYLLSNLPEPDGGAYAEKYAEHPGGVEANVAVALSVLGHDTGIIARVGDDDIGKRVIADLDKRSIDRCQSRVVTGEQSSFCLVFRNRVGERMIVGGGDSTEKLRLDDKNIHYLSCSRCVFTSGYVPTAVLGTLADVRRTGRVDQLVFDIAGHLQDLECRGLSRSDLDAAASAIDLFIGNVSAVRSYVEQDGPGAMIEELRSRGIERGAITQGEDDVILFDPTSWSAIPTFDIGVEDTTGAGDAFSAGLLHAWLLEQHPMERAGRFGAAAGALACTDTGTRNGLPTVDEVEQLLSTSQP